MKFLNCAALGASIKTVSAADCSIILQQAKLLGLQRLGQDPANFTATTLSQLATWGPLLAATDKKKISIIPKKIYAPEFATSEGVMVGSNDNSTPDGRSRLVGESVPRFNGQFEGLTPAQFSDVEDIFAEANANADFDTVGAFIFCGTRQLICSKNFEGLPIHSPFIGTPTGAQLHTLTLSPFGFELEKGWYRDALVVELNFNHNLLKN